MRIIVIGAGEVGSNIARSLADTHDIVVIERDVERVEALTYSADVLPMQGDGTTLETLRAAGIEEADLLIASTDDDETNLVACGTAKTVSDVFTIARVKNTQFLITWRHAEGALGVDFMVCSNLLAAEAVVRVIGLPAARDVDLFAGGRVEMAEFEVPEGSPVAGQTVREADRFDSLTFAAILREDDVEIPRGESRIRPGDRVVVIGSPDSVHEFAAAVAPMQNSEEATDIVIVGGTEIGFQTARLLETRGVRPRMIVADPERALEIAEDLPRTTVLESDATDLNFLDREHVGEADLVVAAGDGDEKNLLVSLLVKHLGVPRTVAIVDNGQYVNLFETVGIDVAVNPREVTAEEITRFTRKQRAENVAIIEGDRAEVLEIEIDAESVLVNRPIREAVGDLPDGIVIGAITRDSKLIAPRGNTVVEVGDHVVVFADADDVSDATAKL